MACRPLALLLAAAFLSSCAQPEWEQAQAKVVGEPVGWLELRVESEDARVQEFVLPDGSSAWFGPPTWFPLAAVSAEERDEGPVVVFRVMPEVADDFHRSTAREVGRRLGLFAGGECLMAPVLQTALPAEAVLHGGHHGWDLAACERVRDRLLAARPVPQRAASATTTGASPQERPPLPADILSRPFERWYTVHWAGRRVGWSVNRLGPHDWEGQRVIRYETERSLACESPDGQHRWYTRSSWYYSAEEPYEALRVESVTSFGTDARTKILKADGEGGAQATFLDGESLRTWSVAEFDADLRDYTDLVEFVRGRPEVGAVCHGSDYSAAMESASEWDAVVVAIEEGGGPDNGRVYVLEIGDRIHEESTTLRLDERGMQVGISAIGSSTTVATREEALASGLHPVWDVPALAWTGELGDDDWRFEFRAVAMDPFAAMARQESSFDADAGVLTVALRRAPSGEDALEPARRARLTGVDWMTPGLTRFAEETRTGIAPDLGDRERVLVALAALSRVVDIDNALSWRSYDVSLAEGRASALGFHEMLIALIRSQGIPARVAGGFKVDRARRELSTDFWTEVHVDGRWTVVDVKAGGFPDSPGYLSLGVPYLNPLMVSMRPQTTVAATAR